MDCGDYRRWGLDFFVGFFVGYYIGGGFVW